MRMYVAIVMVLSITARSTDRFDLFEILLTIAFLEEWHIDFLEVWQSY